jgi:DnaJ-class molecular chaperone
MEYRDYYATLGIPRGATQAEIKKAYRKLARQHHPDVNKADTDAEKRFKEVSEANAVLSDPEKRKAYDSLGANWEAYQHAGAGSGRPGNPFAGFGGFSPGGGGVRFEYRGDPDDLAGFSEFFRTFFAGGASPFEGSARGAPGGRSATGGTRTRVRTGTIEELFADMGEPELAGNGRRRAAPPPASYEAEAEVTLDEVARGTKRHVDVGGRRIEVTIPAGVADGQKIRLSGVGPDRANVYLRVKVLPNSTFTRDGDNLSCELPLTLGEALLGAEVPVETLTGRVLLRIPPETQNGRVFRLKGQGLPRFRGEGRGDLLVRTRVMLPKGLSPEAKEAAEKFIDLAHQPTPRR